MKIFDSAEYSKKENPTIGKTYKTDILSELNAESLCGVFTIVMPGDKGGAYHYHEKREHLIFIIKGEGVEIVEGEEFSVKAGDVIYVPAKVKHTLINKSDKELRYLGYCSCTPGDRDRVEFE